MNQRIVLIHLTFAALVLSGGCSQLTGKPSNEEINHELLRLAAADDAAKSTQLTESAHSAPEATPDRLRLMLGDALTLEARHQQQIRLFLQSQNVKGGERILLSFAPAPAETPEQAMLAGYQLARQVSDWLTAQGYTTQMTYVPSQSPATLDLEVQALTEGPPDA